MKTLPSITLTALSAALAFGVASGVAFAAPQQTTPQQTTPTQQTPPTTQRGQNGMQSQRDSQIRTQVRQKLSQTRSINVSSVTVSVHNGTVTLMGSVSSQSARKQAISAVKDVNGVNRVDASQLKVQGSGM